MIDKIRMVNFKCFREQSLALKEMNIFAGANASGKSSVIQALLLVLSALDGSKTEKELGKVLGGIQIGTPQSLISQDPIPLEGGNFSVGVCNNGISYDVKYSVDKLSPLNLQFARRSDALKKRVYYLNAERIGPRISYPAVIDDTIASNGSNAAYLIDRADLQQRRIPDEFILGDSSAKFSAQVEQWMSLILGDVNFTVNTDLETALTSIRYTNSLAEKQILPTMTGFGISYVLPVVAAGLWCMTEEQALLIIENPEAHLHPLAQSRMGKFLQIVASAGVQLIVETHSEHIIDGARIQAALMGRTDKVGISFFSKKDRDIVVSEIQIDQNGELSDWPIGFFDQKSQDLRELFHIRRKNAGK